MKIEELIFLDVLKKEGWQKTDSIYKNLDRWRLVHNVITISEDIVYFYNPAADRGTFASKIKWKWNLKTGNFLSIDNFYKQLCDICEAQEKEEEHDT